MSISWQPKICKDCVARTVFFFNILKKFILCIILTDIISKCTNDSESSQEYHNPSQNQPWHQPSSAMLEYDNIVGWQTTKKRLIPLAPLGILALTLTMCDQHRS